MAETTQVLEREEAKARHGSTAKLIRTVKKAARRKFNPCCRRCNHRSKKGQNKSGYD